MRAPLGLVLREWGRLGLVGFGGPPAHIALLRRLCVDERRWMDAREFEDANAACGLLPGPASTQLAIFCARRAGGRVAALAGGLAFIVPGLLMVLALAAISLQHAPPDVVRGAAAGAGAAVIAVVVQAGLGLARSTRRNARSLVYMAIAAAVTVVAGAAVVLALLACGLAELAVRRARPGLRADAVGALVWLAVKVGALSYGGGFVIVPLMRSDAVHAHHWMTDTQFLNAVALGQLTPGPVLQTVTAVGYAASGAGGALLASVVAFAPSFFVVALAGERFERLRSNAPARAFLDGAGPAAIGAIFGAVVPLLDGVHEVWQGVLLALAAVGVLVARRGPVVVLLAAAITGAVIGLAGGPLP